MSRCKASSKQGRAERYLEPKPSRPVMPESYQICSDSKGSFLPWSKVEKRMLVARNYWIGTTRPDGRGSTGRQFTTWSKIASSAEFSDCS